MFDRRRRRAARRLPAAGGDAGDEPAAGPDTAPRGEPAGGEPAVDADRARRESDGADRPPTDPVAASEEDVRHADARDLPPGPREDLDDRRRARYLAEALLAPGLLVRTALLLTAVAVLLYALYAVRTTLTLVAVGGFVAIALSPVVEVLHRRVRLPRGPAILLVYAVLLAALVGASLLALPPLVEQIDGLARRIPGWVQQAQSDPTIARLDEQYGLTTKLLEQAESLPGRLAEAAGTLQSVLTGAFTTVFQLVTVLTIAFFMLLQGGALVETALGLVEPRPAQRERLRRVAGHVYRSTAGYVSGAFSIAAINGVLTFLVLSVLGVPYAAPLALLMGVLGLVPMVGATLGGVSIGIVTLFSDFPTDTIVWAVWVVLYQQLENSVLQPAVYKRTVDVPPLLVIVSVLCGASLLGIFGTLVAIPVAAAIRAVLREYAPERFGDGNETGELAGSTRRERRRGRGRHEPPGDAAAAG